MPMAELPTRYYVQTSQSFSTYDFKQGWQTEVVAFDRATAVTYASQFERAQRFENGEDISERTVTIARVVTADELFAESGNALARAESATTKQLWQALENWAAPLIDPAQT